MQCKQRVCPDCKILLVGEVSWLNIYLMKLAYFPNACALNAAPVLDAFLDSARHRYELVEDSMDADIAVIWSVLWHGRMQANQAVYQHYQQHNRPVIVLEIGSLYRGTTWKVSVNNVNADGYFGHSDNLDWDRPRKLGISLAHSISPKPHIIVALQHSRSEQVSKIDNMSQWVEQTVQKIKSHTDRPIIVRPHPRDRLVLNLDNLATIEQPRAVPNTYDSFDMHFDCHAVVNYNSGVGVQAGISGVRPIVDRSSLAWPVGMDITEIEKPYDIDRGRWLAQICHTEYTLEEIRTGLWFRRLEPALIRSIVPA